MDITIKTNTNLQIDTLTLLKMKMLYNYLEMNYIIKKKDDKYIVKNNNGQRQIFTDSYLKRHVKNDDKIIENHTDIHLLTFLYNSLDDGWTIIKNKKGYTFIKKHEGKKEIFSDSYLKRFLEENFDTNKLLKN